MARFVTTGTAECNYVRVAGGDTAGVAGGGDAGCSSAVSGGPGARDAVSGGELVTAPRPMLTLNMKRGCLTAGAAGGEGGGGGLQWLGRLRRPDHWRRGWCYGDGGRCGWGMRQRLRCRRGEWARGLLHCSWWVRRWWFRRWRRGWCGPPANFEPEEGWPGCWGRLRRGRGGRSWRRGEGGWRKWSGDQGGWR